MIKLCFNIPGHKTREFSLDEILTALNITEADNSVCALKLTRNNLLLTAMASDDLDYPGITLDAKDANNQPIYLAQAELPNSDYPDAICARLYAGYAGCETDEPIAMVKTALLPPDVVQAKAELAPACKTVYLSKEHAVTDDYDAAWSRKET